MTRLSASLTLALVVLSASSFGAMGSEWKDPCENGEAVPFPGNHDVWRGVLAAHVSRGVIAGINSSLVDYPAVRADPSQLRGYLASLCNVDVGSMTADERLALWLNAYNSVMMMMIVHFDPPQSVKQISNIVNQEVWDYKFATVAGMKVSLADIEHRQIRGDQSTPLWNGAAAQVSPKAEGRVHACMVCASLSCPDLPTVPFEAATLQDQLTSYVRAWIGNPTKNHGPSSGTLLINSVFNWFTADFGRESVSLRSFLALYAPASWGDIGDSTPISYMEYNWALNAKDGDGVFVEEEEQWYDMVGVQIALVAAGVVLIGIVAVVAFCAIKRRRAKGQPADQSGASDNQKCPA